MGMASNPNIQSILNNFSTCRSKQTDFTFHIHKHKYKTKTYVTFSGVFAFVHICSQLSPAGVNNERLRIELNLRLRGVR